MTREPGTGAGPGGAARATLLFLVIVLGVLVVGAAGAVIGWRLVRAPALVERSTASIEALVRDALGDATDPAAAQATLMRLGFDQVGHADDGRTIWGVAHEGPGRFHLELREARVEVTLEESGRVARISASKGARESP